MYEKDGEKYFIVDSHMHYWNAAPDNWVKGAEQYAKGWIECFHAYQGLGPKETHWPIEKFKSLHRGRPDEGRLRGRPRGHRDLPADVPQGVVHRGLQHHRAERARWGRSTRACSSPTPGSTRATATTGLEELRAQRRAVRLQGRQALHRRVEQRLARLQAQRPGRLPLPGEGPGARHQEHPRAQGPDDLAAGQGRVRRVRRRPRRDRLPRAELHRRARRPAADRGLLLHGDAGAQRLRRPVGRHRRPHARAAEVLRQGHGRAAVLGRRGQDDLRQRLRHLGAEVADRGLRRLADARRRRVLRLPASSPRPPRRRSSA